MARKVTAREKRKARIRRKISGTAARPRLTIYRSLRHMYAQLVDDVAGTTLVSIGSTAKGLKEEVSEDDKTAAAKKVGVALAKAALAGKVDGKLVDLSHVVARDAALEIVTVKHADALEIVRHSTAHLLAQATQRLFPDTQVTIGPPI